MDDKEKQKPQPPSEGRVPRYWKRAVLTPRLAIAGAVVLGVIAVSTFHLIHMPDMRAMAERQAATMRSNAAGASDGKPEDPDPTTAPLPSRPQSPAVAVAHLLGRKPSPTPVPVAQVIAQAAVVTAPAKATETPTTPPGAHLTFGDAVAQVAEAPSPAPVPSASGVGYVAPVSRYELQLGDVIHARLTTKLDSTQGGIVKASVVEPVYSPIKPFPEVIPAGAILVAVSSTMSSGDTRPLPTWVRVNFPDGRAFNFAEQSADQNGTSGLSGHLDTHAGKAFGSALATTLLSAVGNSFSRSSTVVVGGGITSAIPQPQAQKPSFYAEVGTRVDVLVTRDLALDPVSEEVP